MRCRESNSYRRFATRVIVSFGVLAGVSLRPDLVRAQNPAYSAAQAPAAWQAYAKNVQARLREWLADEELAKRFQEATQKDSAKDKPRDPVVAKVWISATGKVERVLIVGLESGAAEKLRIVLEHRDIGLSPPPDMLQPLNLKLSAGDKG